MTVTEEPFQITIVEQAGEWYVRHQDGNLSPAEKEEFMSWLQASPLHVREYLAAAAVAKCLPAAIEELETDRQSLLGHARNWLRTNENVIPLRAARVRASDFEAGASAKHRFNFRGKLIAGLAVLALSLGSFAYWGWGTLPAGMSGWPRTLEAPRGEQRTMRLRDGSVLHLNADTRLRVRYTQTRRLIDLEHGQALFNVAQEKDRPFIVRAGTAKVVAIGTQFDVVKRSSRDAVTITVVEGKVAVFEQDQAEPVNEATELDRVPHSVQLTAGQRLQLKSTRVYPHVETVDTRAATAWLRRDLIFTEERLADVAEEFSRYGVSVQIEDPALREYRVNGVFSAYDAESFVVYLRRIGEVEQAGSRIRVYRKNLAQQK